MSPKIGKIDGSDDGDDGPTARKRDPANKPLSANRSDEGRSDQGRSDQGRSDQGRSDRGKARPGAKAEKAEEVVPSPSENSQRLVEVKVGAFVFITLVAAVAIVLLLAQKRHVFEKRTVIHTVFQEVEGLREGAPVRLSGVNIGQVSRISFAKERHASLINVDMEISKESLGRIGVDSVARIGSQGLLGDKIIEVSVSGETAEPLAAGATLQSQPPADFNKIIQQASAVLTNAEVVAKKAAALMEGVGDEKSIENIKGIIESAHKLAATAEKGPGLVHALFYDPDSAKSMRAILGQVDLLSQHVDEAVRKVDGILNATDDNGRQLVNNVSRAAKNIGDTVADVHSSKIIPHLDQASGDLAQLTSYVKAGHGTVGMAIMDPTVYEQLMTVLGGVARSRVLRALVRYAILKDDGQKIGKAVDEPTPRGARVVEEPSISEITREK